MKYFFIILFILLSNSGKSQLTTTIRWQLNKNIRTKDTVYYDPSVKLIWNDFKGAPDMSSKAAAITASGFGYAMAIQSKNGVATLDITVMCYFIKPRSWVKDNMNSDYALTHEQHHFDITYINACLFVKKLREANFTTDNYKSVLRKLYSESQDSMHAMQNSYDGETKNGQLKNIQSEWNKKIDLQLVSVITH